MTDTDPTPERRWRVDERGALFQPDGGPVGELFFFADRASILATLNEAETLRATNARLERERDEARRELAEEVDNGRKLGDVIGELTLDLDAARADAARMRLVLEEIADSAINDCWHVDEARAALTPDDGWLARKLAEAVEPYREALRRLDGLRESPAPNYPEECECDREDESDEATLCLLHARMFFSLERNTLCFMLVDMMAACGQYSAAIETEARALLGGTPTDGP